MRIVPMLAAGCFAALLAPGLAAQEASAEVKVGRGVEAMEVKEPSDNFTVPANTRIFVWTKVAGCAETRITIQFIHGDRLVAQQELPIPRSPFRTYAYRTFRVGDGGAWTAKVMAQDGTELGSAAFKVQIEP